MSATGPKKWDPEEQRGKGASHGNRNTVNSKILFENAFRPIARPMKVRPRMAVAVESLSLEQALWLSSSFATVHRIAFDANLFAQRCPPPIAIDSFNSAIGELGLACEWSSAGLATVLSRRLPVALLLAKVDDKEGSDWALVLNADEQSVWLLERGASQPSSVAIDDVERRYGGRSLALWPNAAAADDPDSIEPRTARFGIRWFVPELRKHKSIWCEVLLASLVLQLMALATPLFTQVVIDKVVVHRTNSTLIAIGVGLIVFLVFTTVLTWVRQYLILHTGQRIDAVLGSRVFDHLFRLPALYFQHRPTGVIAARLHGIETIRDFIA